MIARYIDETTIESFPNYIERDGMIYTNEAAREIALSGEWKEVVEEPVPQVDDDHYLERHYVVEDEIIRLTWIVRERPEMPENA